MEPAVLDLIRIDTWGMTAGDEPIEEAEPIDAIDHYDNGNVRYRGFHLDGEMHGAWAFYRADGSLMRSGSLDRGRQVGLWRTFDRAGKVVKETTFD